ncbi:DUF955 domain-containing protein [Lysinibacillus macroides]|uniref:IrrE N-terminal-like domain-containing protein n=1 Tax=Lysinibacillus macroides TaxID=33935 RepID=A0A0N0CVC9_9BACI|nr:DUF955 domain-containing protein [Lysinibacillus macroides]KOY81294.1 hypothetical protein ADM90_19355 [Lysinibacillus macroides]QPR68544.1 DUF955 domain-containing protein [Lysinibacillus macroides]
MLPNNVKVGGVNYTVEEVPHLIADQELWGQILMRDAKIQIDSSLGVDRKRQTLIHELTHAIFLEAGYKDQDEDMINRVSIVLHQVLQDNPSLFHSAVHIAEKFTMKKLKKRERMKL